MLVEGGDKLPRRGRLLRVGVRRRDGRGRVDRRPLVRIDVAGQGLAPLAAGPSCKEPPRFAAPPQASKKFSPSARAFCPARRRSAAKLHILMTV